VLFRSFLSHPPTVSFAGGSLAEPFVLRGFANRSGVTAGRLTLTDRATGAYVWYVVEARVRPPEPEDAIAASTTVRGSVTIRIPVQNPTPLPVVFAVAHGADDLFGPPAFEVPPASTAVYELVFSPLQSFTRVSHVSFDSAAAGEYVYELRLASDPPDVHALAPLSSPVGRFASATIALQNPLERRIVLRVEVDGRCFRALSKPALQLEGGEKRQLEVRYLPASIGAPETALLTLRSREIGEWVYRLTGVGRPPPPLSPVVVECAAGESVAGAVEFANPFQEMAKFEVAVSGGDAAAFRLLSKRRAFTLLRFGDVQQVSFAFAPPAAGQFRAALVVATSAAPRIDWSYPIIGTTFVGQSRKVVDVRGRAGEIIEMCEELPLAAESENYAAAEYALAVVYPKSGEWLSRIFTVRIAGVNRETEVTKLAVEMEIRPRRPLQEVVRVGVENPLGQRWEFPVSIVVDPGDPCEAITLEAAVGQVAVGKLALKDRVLMPTPFHAYFANGSAPEFVVRPGRGMIEPGTEDEREFPFEVLFRPKAYGTIPRALLVVDTAEVQYLFDVSGGFPEYQPPVIKAARVDTNRAGSEMQSSRSRDIIRENIIAAKFPKSSLRV
jgi:hypothetical protein